MRYYTYLICIIIVFTCFLQSCRQHEAGPDVAERDTTITIRNSVSELFFDSLALESFITTHPMHDTLSNKLRSFYNSRNYQFAWFFRDGMADYASTFLALQNNYIGYSGDSTLYNASLQESVDSLQTDSLIQATDTRVLDTELTLTYQFLRYTYRAYAGRGVNVKDLNWFIPRKKINPVDFLDSMLINKGKNLAAYEPVNRQYNLLKQQLLKYYEIEKSWPKEKIAADKVYRLGDSSETVHAIKYRLHLLGDLAEYDSSGLFTEETEDAVKIFQRRHGLTEDGVAGKAFFTKINEPINEFTRRLLINMERMRWVPAEPAGDYMLVNIPEFRLHVFESGKLAWSMDVVVGSTAHHTVIFHGDMKYVVFSPYWNVPPGIAKNEIIPALRKNPDYLASHNMEKYAGGFRQKPGPNNALGLVKFLFPNSYNIYLHDTPAKSLFKESKRAFSHGCIRLSDAKKLATYLLRNDTTWTDKKITQAMNSRKEKYVTLEKTIPVFIGYFTAWVNSKGELNFRDDVYGHDGKMAGHLFASHTPASATK